MMTGKWEAWKKRAKALQRWPNLAGNCGFLKVLKRRSAGKTYIVGQWQFRIGKIHAGRGPTQKSPCLLEEVLTAREVSFQHVQLEHVSYND